MTTEILTETSGTPIPRERPWTITRNYVLGLCVGATVYYLGQIACVLFFHYFGALQP